MNVYFISGLGADKRIFQKLILPKHFEPVYLEWLIPHKIESLPAYAGRMALSIDATQPFYLVGVSFGGMIATEIAKQIRPQKTILISSISTSNQLPWYYHFFGRLAVDKLIPVSFLTSANSLTYWLFGATDSSTGQLLKQILNDTDKGFLKWAIRTVATWNNQIKPVDLVQVHGTSDKVLPIQYTAPDLVVPAGGHLMVYSQSDVISELLGQLLA